MLQRFFLFSFIFLLIGCGYRPVANYARDMAGERVYVSLNVSLSNPENSSIVKDALLEAMYSRLEVEVVEREKADSRMQVSLSSVGFSDIQYDSQGYVITKRANVSLSVVYERGDKKKTYSSSGSYDFSIEANSNISDAVKTQAITNAATKALDAFIIQLANDGVRHEDKRNSKKDLNKAL